MPTHSFHKVYSSAPPVPSLFQILDVINSSPRVSIFVPKRGFESMIALWVMAVGTVLVGSLWAAPADRRKTVQRLVESRDNEEDEHPS